MPAILAAGDPPSPMDDFDSERLLMPPALTAPQAPRSWRNRLAQWAVFHELERLTHGHLSVVDSDGTRSFGHISPEFDVAARITVHDPIAYERVALGGTIGAAEAYSRGLWSVDNLTAAVRLFARNRHLIDGNGGQLGHFLRPFHWMRHQWRTNTLRGSRQNIEAHYDLGNDFFASFLDPSMMYSCAVFPAEGSTLEEASRFKNDLICRKLNLSPGDELLEIGGGWGGLALHASAQHGCRVVTTTISPAQFDYAVARVKAAGLESKVTVINCDYRQLATTLGRRFDKVVSIEMIEAVGWRFLNEYFEICSNLLKPRGVMLLQAIVIADELYEGYRRSVDFIQRYIFPGGCLPSLAAIRQAVSQVTDLSIFHLEDITPHYARTLAAWRRNFTENLTGIRELGYPESLLRMWEYYLCYCEGGFLERTIGNVQIVFSKPDGQPAVSLG